MADEVAAEVRQAADLARRVPDPQADLRSQETPAERHSRIPRANTGAIRPSPA